jgi:hypothetical protein
VSLDEVEVFKSEMVFRSFPRYWRERFALSGKIADGLWSCELSSELCVVIDQFSFVVNGEELIVVFVKKRGTASDDGMVDFQPKNATFEQGCVGGTKALECQGDAMLGDESEDCLLGEDHCKGKGTVSRNKVKDRYKVSGVTLVFMRYLNGI